MFKAKRFVPVMLSTVLLTGAYGAGSPDAAARSDKALIVDGSVVHDLGRLANNVTNWGLIGSQPSRPSAYGDAPSATWPRGSDTVHLWGAGLWVGGVVLDEHLVSTGSPASEIMATSAPGDTIFSTTRGTPGGRRYPLTGADDDGDGLEDEDRLDGLDNDGDGLTDEDYAAAGDQSFVCTMYDNTPEALQNNPDHTPLNIRVTQRSFQWADAAAADFIGYEYTVTNVGVVDIEQVYCGLMSDFDIGSRSGSDIAADDLAGGWAGEAVEAADGTVVPVSVAYMRDAALVDPRPGWAGWVMCGLETDAAAGLSGSPLDLPTLQIFRGNLSFSQGGDPTNDDERYQMMSSGAWDPDAPAAAAADYRVLIATPALSVLAPGESLTFRVALVVGAGLDQMLAGAAEAVLTARGKSFDRDGDPANGAEFNVPWMRPYEDASDVPPDRRGPAVVFDPAPNPFNPATTLAFDLKWQASVRLRVFDASGRLVRTLLDGETLAAGRNETVWNGRDDAGRNVAAGVYFLRLEAGGSGETRRAVLVK